MSVEITRPTEGGVTFTLPYDEAEVLLRLVGLSNSGSLRKAAPVLYDLVTSDLVEEFGRSIPSEARKYAATCGGHPLNSQVYIEEVER